MCCAVAFSSRSKQSHLLVPSLVSQSCSAKEEQQQEKGQLFQEEIQALGRSEGGSDGVTQMPQVEPIPSACSARSWGGFRPDFSHPQAGVAACAAAQRHFGT